MPSLAAPLIMGGASVLGDLFNIDSGKKQHKRNIELWRMNNAYNHPTAQMQRLQEAGLNPNLIYGTGTAAATGSSSSPPATAKRQNVNLSKHASNYIQANTMALQNDNLRAQNTVLQNDAKLKAANTLKTLTEKDLKGVDLQKARDTYNDIIRGIASDSDIKGYKASLGFQNMMENTFNADQTDLIREANLSARINKLLQSGSNLRNSEKLEQLRDLEIELKKKTNKFFESNAILDIIGKFLGLNRR